MEEREEKWGVKLQLAEEHVSRYYVRE